jgi:hypothetical protein
MHGDNIVSPHFTSKNLLVSAAPQSPHACAFEKDLDGVEFDKFYQQFLSENICRHLKGCLGAWVCLLGPHLVDHSRHPVPNSRGCGAMPESVEHQLFLTGVAKTTIATEFSLYHVSPSIHSNAMVLN